MPQTTEALATQKEGKLLLRLAAPAITAQLINVLYNLVDRMYIGHIPDIGATALTGVGVTLPAILAISAFAALAGMGGAPRASILLGKGDREEAERTLGNCFDLMLALAVALTTVFLLFGQEILRLFGASDNTIGYAWQYMRIYALGTIFVQLSLGLNAFINAQGFAKMGMFTVAVGAVCNIILDPIFIFGFGMGVRGAAWATVLSQAVSCAYVLWFLCSRRSLLRLRLRAMRPSWRVLAPSVALGASPFVMQFTESVLTVSFNTSLLRYGGDLAVGAMTILSSVMQFSMLPLQGLTQGAQPIVSYNYGAGNFARVQRTFKLLLRCSLLYSTLLWAVCMFAPGLFVGMFIASGDTLAPYATWALRVYMATSCVFGAQIACQQTFIALGNAKTSLFLALLRKVFLLIPLIFVLPMFLSDQVLAVFLAEPIADLIAVCTTCTMFFFFFRRLRAQMTAPPVQLPEK